MNKQSEDFLLGIIEIYTHFLFGCEPTSELIRKLKDLYNKFPESAEKYKGEFHSLRIFLEFREQERGHDFPNDWEKTIRGF